MQLIGALFTEIINIILICGQETIMDTIVNFIALGVIAEIDNYYYDALATSPFKQAVEEPLKVSHTSKSLPFEDRPRSGKCLRFNYRLIRIWYISAYYYFTPFLTPIITYLVAGGSQIRQGQQPPG
jgi:hypothetical protein